MISVLCPSRGRPESLMLTARQLIDLAADRDQVEILVALDPDEYPASAAWDLPGQVRLWGAPQRYGYAGLQHYANHLLAMASPDATWLLNWNDDATMLTAGWDLVIRGQEPAILWSAANHNPGACMFPAWPAAWSRTLGHVSPVPHIDTYLQWLGEDLGLLRKIPVEVLHDRADLTGSHDDATYAQGRKRLGAEGMVPGGIPDRGAVARDAETIRQLRKGARVAGSG